MKWRKKGGHLKAGFLVEGPRALVVGGVETAQHHVLELPVAKGGHAHGVGGQDGELAGREGSLVTNERGLHLPI